MFTAPHLDYALLAPILILLAGGLIGVGVEAFVQKSLRATVQLWVALATVLAAFTQLMLVRNQRSTVVAIDSFSFDGATVFMQATILVLAFFALLLIADRGNFVSQASAIPGSEDEANANSDGKSQTEVFPLTLFAISGMMLFPAATDLITLFVALEILSLPLYLMAGLSRRRRLLSQEAALKYFLLGAYSSAFFLFGSAFLYGYSGSLTLNGIASAIAGNGGNDIFLLLGIVFLMVGLLFKIGAVPFHSWTPDVYQGAPTPITGFMAACTKVAAVGAMLRIFYVALSADLVQWRPIVTAISIITMLVGAIAAMSQRDVKRTLAFSSIAHAGFLLIGVIALNQSGLKAALFYLVAYGFATLGAFTVVTLVRDSSGEVTDMNRWVGLGKKSPLIAGTFCLFLLSFGGIPLTSGFIAKFSIFTAAYEGGNTTIVVFGVLTSAIALFFYLRVIILLFFTEPKSDVVTVSIPSLKVSFVLAASVIVTILLGVYPSLLLNSAQSFATFLR